LLNPSDAGTLSGKDVFFGVATVSINPGTETKQNFAGELTSQVQLNFGDARSCVLDAMLAGRVKLPPAILAKLASDANIPFETFTNQSDITNYTQAQYTALHGSIADPEHAQQNLRIPKSWDVSDGANHSDPMILTVTPGMDVQTLDLENSLRRQFEMSLKLAVAMQYAGIKGAANSFFDYARKVESDARTRTPIPVVNAYSITGDSFGFQIGPRYQALASITDPKAEGAEILYRQWFPAIIILGLDKTTIRPMILAKTNNDNSVTYSLQEPKLRILPTARWVRLDTGFWGLRSRFAEQDYLELSMNLNREMTALSNAVSLLGSQAPGEVSGPYGLLKARTQSLKDLTFAVSADQVFAPDKLLTNLTQPPQTNAPSPKTVTVSTIDPASILLVRDTAQNVITQTVVFAIQGTALKQLDPQKISVASGSVDSLAPLSSSDTSIVLKGNVSSDSSALVFQLPFKNDTNTPPVFVFTKPVPVSIVPKPTPPPVTPTLTALYKRTWTSTTNDAGVSTTLSVETLPTSDTNVLRLIQAVSDVPEPKNGKFSISVNSKAVEVSGTTNEAPSKTP
jgi:hypothetical protein